GKESVQIGEDRRGVVITMRSDQLLFRPGRAEVRPEAYPLLDRIARTLGQMDNLIQVEGHTCDLKPRRSVYASNWELSTARATNVLRYLVEQDGLPAFRFSAAGCGSARPRVPNNSEANRRRNRRVEIVILRPDSVAGTLPTNEPRRLSDPNAAVFKRRLD
ncbi:MAG: OmpA family protein, partial [Armatimonadetes bacterium]|nr:OmpA family protein [Armatimonadota bacterium]